MTDFPEDGGGGNGSDIEADDPLDVAFTKATEHVARHHSDLAPNDLLELYGLFKQATVGRCNTTKPNIFQMQGRAKWNAWNELGDMTTVKAKGQYIEKVQSLDPEWFDALKNGDTAKSPTSGWVVHSVELPPDDGAPEKPEHEKNSFDYVKEGNVERLRDTITHEELNAVDENGLGLIHWATDRNYVDVLRFLIEAGADVNLRDADQQQTPLHYAASCGHPDCIRVLLNAHADRLLQDGDGQTCMDVAELEEIRMLLEN